MNATFSIRDEFGSHLADGTKAADFRMTKVDAYVVIAREITLDFTGVRNANSSFINALVAGLIEQHGLNVLEKLVFKGCNPAVQVLIEAAVDLGASKVSDRASA